MVVVVVAVQVGYKISHSAEHPERDFQFFQFLMRDTGKREDQRAESQQFIQKHIETEKSDRSEKRPLNHRVSLLRCRLNQPAFLVSRAEGKPDLVLEDVPESLIFLFRVLGLIRGLCTILPLPCVATTPFVTKALPL